MTSIFVIAVAFVSGMIFKLLLDIVFGWPTFLIDRIVELEDENRRLSTWLSHGLSAEKKIEFLRERNQASCPSNSEQP